MGVMNFVVTNPLTNSINLHVISAHLSKRHSSLASGSNFHRLGVKEGFHYNVSPIGQDRRRRTVVISSSSQPVPPPVEPSKLQLHGEGWIAVTTLSFLLSCMNEGGAWPSLKKEAHKKLQTLENVTEMFEKVAHVVRQMAEDAANGLPDGVSKDVAISLMNAAQKMENVAHVTDTTFHAIDETMDKFKNLSLQFWVSLVTAISNAVAVMDQPVGSQLVTAESGQRTKQDSDISNSQIQHANKVYMQLPLDDARAIKIGENFIQPKDDTKADTLKIDMVILGKILTQPEEPKEEDQFKSYNF